MRMRKRGEYFTHSQSKERESNRLCAKRFKSHRVL